MKKTIFNGNGWVRTGLLRLPLMHMGSVILCVLLGCTSPSSTSSPSRQRTKAFERLERYQSFSRDKQNFYNFDSQIALVRLRAGGLSTNFLLKNATDAEGEALVAPIRKEIQELKTRIGDSKEALDLAMREIPDLDLDFKKHADKKFNDYKADLCEISMLLDKELDGLRGHNQAREEEAIKVAGWRINNAEILKQVTNNAEIEIVKIGSRSSSDLSLWVSVSNTSSNAILRPINVQVWGYDEESPNRGGSYAIGAKLTDSFGNFYRLENIDPKFYSSSSGIRPGDSRIFTLRFAEMPLSNASEIRLTLEAGAFGQSKDVIFTIPRSVFFGAVATHDLIRQ